MQPSTRSSTPLKQCARWRTCACTRARTRAHARAHRRVAGVQRPGPHVRAPPSRRPHHRTDLGCVAIRVNGPAGRGVRLDRALPRTQRRRRRRRVHRRRDRGRRAVPGPRQHVPAAAQPPPQRRSLHLRHFTGRAAVRGGPSRETSYTTTTFDYHHPTTCCARACAAWGSCIRAPLRRACKGLGPGPWV